MLDQVKTALAAYGGTWQEKKGVWEYKAVIAERKAFLSTKKLSYLCRVRIDDDARGIKFSEMLMEAGSGLSTGGDFEGGMSSGFGFKAESYNTMKGTREGNIEEQSNLFGKKFEYKFNYAEVRSKVEEAAKTAGYNFEYQLLPVK